jgi:hypothetical protein
MGSALHFDNAKPHAYFRGRAEEINFVEASYLVPVPINFLNSCTKSPDLSDPSIPCRFLANSSFGAADAATAIREV